MSQLLKIALIGLALSLSACGGTDSSASGSNSGAPSPSLPSDDADSGNDTDDNIDDTVGDDTTGDSGSGSDTDTGGSDDSGAGSDDSSDTDDSGSDDGNIGGGNTGGSDDTSGGSDDTSGGSDDTSGGSDDTSGGSDDTSGGSDDTSGGSDDTSGGSDDTSGGSDDTSGGSDDTSGGSDDTSGGSDDTSGGSDDTSGGSDDTSGGSDDTSGGSDDTSGGSDDTPVSSAEGAILFVTQTPLPSTGPVFTTIVSNFSNHLPYVHTAPRGGDLWIRYADGTLRNLTEEAGFGENGRQGTSAIAVRNPAVHWDGSKALFSMVTGAPEAQYRNGTYYWQIYEVTGFGKGEEVSITRVADQPVDYNNVSAIYAESGTTDSGNDDIIFSSDMTHGFELYGTRHLYPQREEYDGAPTVTGLFRLDRETGNTKRLTHSPSGDFTPIIDSFGRLIFPRWDHLQQDQQNPDIIGAANRFGEAVDYTSEAPDATIDPAGPQDIFPEHLSFNNIVVDGKNGIRFNQFFLWEASPVDGSESEVINHLGRQELYQSFSLPSFAYDSNLREITNSLGLFAKNELRINAPGGTFQPQEDPNNPGTFYMTHTGEFFFCGGILYFKAVPGDNPEDIVMRERAELTTNRNSHCYRNPLPMKDGSMVAAYSPQLFGDTPMAGSFRLRFVNEDGTPGDELTDGISKTVSYWNPDRLVQYSGELWELDPVEVTVRERPEPFHVARTADLPDPEQRACEAAFSSPAACEQGLADLRQYLADNNLAMVVSRNVTARDRGDLQQPFNLRIPGGVSSDTSGGSSVYDVTHLQLLQANLVRSYTGRSTGRRPQAQIMSDSIDPTGSTENGSVQLGADGSMAAFVPAERAVTWHLIDKNIPENQDQSIVKERYWVSFAKGEIRVCASCHGVNKEDQLGRPAPTNTPEAFTELLRAWMDTRD